jgi:hypothetical protein
MITRTTVRDQILAYLNHTLTLAQLVDWAENTMNESTFDQKDSELLGDVVSRIGLADVEEFGLSWDDCYDFLSRLGYKVQVMAA